MVLDILIKRKELMTVDSYTNIIRLCDYSVPELKNKLMLLDITPNMDRAEKQMKREALEQVKREKSRTDN